MIRSDLNLRKCSRLNFPVANESSYLLCRGLEVEEITINLALPLLDPSQGLQHIFHLSGDISTTVLHIDDIVTPLPFIDTGCDVRLGATVGVQSPLQRPAPSDR